MRDERRTIILVLKVLEEHSDEKHILSMSEIISIIKHDWGITLDRRTITSSIKALIELEYDISIYSENKKGYYLRERSFEISEIVLMMDAIYSYRGIPSKQTTFLIEKLQKSLSKYQRKNYKNLVSVKPIIKTQNKQVFYNIEQLDEAINQKKQVSFIYNSYGFDKQLKPRRSKPFIVNPYLMISENEHYYLICETNSHANISYNILDIDSKAVPEDVNLDNYSKKAASIYYGDEENFTFRCKNSILSDVIDKFGVEINLYNITEETFDFTIKLVDKAALFFALEYISRCEILMPKHARERMKRYVQSGMERYMK